MAVQPQTPYIEYTANGSTNSFALEFDCENQDHLIVLVDDIEPVVGTWSLIGGAVVFGTAPGNGKKIIIQRNTPFRRDGDFQSYDNSFRPGPVNKGLDKVWWKIQELGVADWLLGLKIQKFRDDVNLTALENTLEEAKQIRDDTADSVVEVQSNVAQSQSLLTDTTNQANLAQGYASSANSANAAAQQAVIDVSTAEADVYSALSAQQIAVNNSLTAIAGGHKAYQTLALAQAAQATLPANTVVEVTNDPDSTKNGTYQWDGTTLTKSAYDVVAQIESNPNVKAKNIPSAIDFNDYRTSGQYTISTNTINASTNTPSNTGGVLEVIGSGAEWLTSQKFTTYSGTTYTRSLQNSWTPWIKVAMDSGRNILTAVDFNDLKSPGNYTISYDTVTTGQNAPPITSGGVLIVEGNGLDYLTTQRFTSWTGVVYTRSLQNSWTNWVKAIQSSDIANTNLTTAIDFDTYNTPKTYTITYDAMLTSSNKPPSSVGGVLEVVGSGGVYLTHQFFRDYNGNCFYRAKQNNWGNWKKIVTSEDIVPNVSALNGKKWLAIGDSITFGLNNTSNKSYANVLAERHGATLTKHATSGAWVSAGTGVVSIPNILSQTYTSLSDAANYDLITIAAGTNDRISGAEGSLGGFTDRTTATFYGALHTLFAGLKSKYPNARMLFISQISRSGLRTNTASPTALDLKFKAIVEVCDYYSVPVWAGHKEFGFHPDDNETFKSSYMPDGLHPNDVGQVWLANRLEQTILSCAK